MNCQSFRKYIGAFADGELEVSQNLEALEHLNMCPSCAARVTNINELKEAINRAYQTERRRNRPGPVGPPDIDMSHDLLAQSGA